MKKKSAKRNFLEWAAYAALRFFGAMASLLPASWLKILGAGIGRLVFRLSEKHRNIALQGVNVCFGNERDEEERRRIALRGFESMGKNLLLFLKLPAVSRERLKADVTFVNEENLKDALARGKGVLLLSAHMGNWEYAGAAIAARGYPVVGVVQRISNPWVDSYVSNIRHQKGIPLVVRSRASTEDYVRVLNENKILILVTDQNAAHRGVPAKFFGVDTPTFVGWITLSRRTDAAVVPAFSAYENGRLCIFFEKPVDISEEENLQKTYIVNAERVNAIIEKYIRRYPEQWFWLHNRWRV